MERGNTDEQLLRAFLAGRRVALGELARRHERSLLGLALGLLGGRRDLACDAVQETWVRVIRFGHRFDGRSSLKTWLYRIAVNQCRSLREAERAVGNRTQDRPPDRGGGKADCAVEAADRSRALRDAVAQLDGERRTVILLCYHSGMTHAEAAEILGLPLGTLKSRLHAGLEELRSLLPAEVKHE